MRYYTVDKKNKMISFTFDHDKNIISELKRCSVLTHWNPELRKWIIPIDEYSVKGVVDFVKEQNFREQKLIEIPLPKYDYSVKDTLMKKILEICKKRNFTYTPRDYQLEGLHYGMKQKNFINGDDVGLGKTFEAIIYAEVTKSFPCLVVVPASVKYNWAEKWAEIVGPHRTISVIESSKKTNDWKADIVIINYDIIAKKQGKGVTVKYIELAKTLWKMFIFDEGHFLKEENSQRSRVARMITKKSDAIIQLLTGTATMSRPSELWNLLIIIKKEHLIADSWEKFIQKYCGGYRGRYGWIFTGATNTLALNKVLRDTCYLRREKRDVLKDLPDIETVILRMPITNKSKIDKATENLYEYLLETKGEEAAERAMEAESLVALGVLRKLAIEGKLKAIEQYLKDWKVGGKKLLVFGIHKEPLEYLSEKFKSPLIAGGVTAKKKQAIIKEYISNDEPFLFANMTSAGTGVDGLQTVCSNMIILELPWRPSDLTQLVARMDRSGQNEPMTARYMLSDQTIDKEMWEMLESKEADTEAVNKGVDVVSQKSGMRIVMKKILKKREIERESKK